MHFGTAIINFLAIMSNLSQLFFNMFWITIQIYLIKEPTDFYSHMTCFIYQTWWLRIYFKSYYSHIIFLRNLQICKTIKSDIDIHYSCIVIGCQWNKNQYRLTQYLLHLWAYFHLNIAFGNAFLLYWHYMCISH